MAQYQSFTPDAHIELVHVIYPDDYFCVGDRILDAALDAMVDRAIEDHIKNIGPISEDADGDLIIDAIRKGVTRPTDLEEAKALLSDLGLMTFARL